MAAPLEGMYSGGIDFAMDRRAILRASDKDEEISRGGWQENQNCGGGEGGKEFEAGTIKEKDEVGGWVKTNVLDGGIKAAQT